MKKLVLFFSIVVSVSILKAQDANEMMENAKAKVDTVEGWKYSGVGSFLFNQNAFSNWAAGGVNSISGTLTGTFGANLKRGRHFWDNSLYLGYGLNKIDGVDSNRKTEDRLEFNSTYGYHLKKNWFFATALGFRSQFAEGFDYTVDPQALNPISAFMAPGYLNFGVGVQWRKSDKFWVSLLPLNNKNTFVMNDKIDETLYGLDMGKTNLFQLGFLASAYYETELFKNGIWINRLSLFSNYLEKPQNVDVNYETALNLVVNKYITTTLSLNLIYDDDIRNVVNEQGVKGPRLQVKELFGLGINYTFF